MATDSGLVAGIEPSLKLPFGEETIDYTPPWARRSYAALLEEHAGLAIDDVAGARAKVGELGLEVEGQRANANNHLLMHAMGPNVCGVIGSAIAAGVLLSLVG